jgi:hypothetical protein
MTQRYAHLRDEALTAASNVAGDLFTEAAEAARAKENQGNKSNVTKLRKKGAN